jgi:hypothetical protein
VWTSPSPLPPLLRARTRTRSYGHYTLNLLLNFKRLGYAHVLLLGAGREQCEAATAFSPLPTRCVWDGRWTRDARLRAKAAPWASFCPSADCSSTQEPQGARRVAPALRGRARARARRRGSTVAADPAASSPPRRLPSPTRRASLPLARPPARSLARSLARLLA